MPTRDVTHSRRDAARTRRENVFQSAALIMAQPSVLITRARAAHIAPHVIATGTDIDTQAVV